MIPTLRESGNSQILWFSRFRTWGRSWTSSWICTCNIWNGCRCRSRSITQPRALPRQLRQRRKRTTGILIWKPSSATILRQAPRNRPTASTRCPLTKSAPMGFLHMTLWTCPEGDPVLERFRQLLLPRQQRMQRGPRFFLSWLFSTPEWAATPRLTCRALILTESPPSRDVASRGTATHLCPWCRSTTRSWRGLRVASASPRTEMIMCLAPMGGRAGWGRSGTSPRVRRTQTRTPSRPADPCLCRPQGMGFLIQYGPLPTSPFERGHWLTPPCNVDRLCIVHLLSHPALTSGDTNGCIKCMRVCGGPTQTGASHSLFLPMSPQQSASFSAWFAWPYTI